VYRQMFGGEGGVNICKAQIYTKRHFKKKKIHLIGRGGVWFLNWEGKYTPLGCVCVCVKYH